MSKSFSDCYLYKANSYEANLINFINKSTFIDKNSDKFHGVLDAFKRAYPRWTYKFINSDALQFMVPSKKTLINKSFNGFACRSESQKRVIALVNAYLLDVSMKKKDTLVLPTSSISVMHGYVLSAFNNYIYLINPETLTKNSKIIVEGAELYSKLYINLLHYLYKIRNNEMVTEEVKFYVKMYYYTNLLGFEVDKALKYAKQKCPLSEARINLLDADQVGRYRDINVFINDTLAQYDLMNGLTLSIFVEKWLYLYGSGTEFALELLPAYLTMITNHYVSSYVTNVNTLQALMGNKNVIGAEINRIGGYMYG